MMSTRTLFAEKELSVLLQEVMNQIQLEIFNMMGQRVKQDQITSKEGLNQISFDLTSHDPGVYILKINNGVEKYTKKIILQ